MMCCILIMAVLRLRACFLVVNPECKVPPALCVPPSLRRHYGIHMPRMPCNFDHASFLPSSPLLRCMAMDQFHMSSRFHVDLTSRSIHK